MQYKEVMVDLRMSRRESGLTQEDLAHLLGTRQSRISRLEKGKSVLTTGELCKLSIIYNKSLSDLFKLLTGKLQAQLHEQLQSMSGNVSEISHDAEQRQVTLHHLFERLAADSKNQHEN